MREKSTFLKLISRALKVYRLFYVFIGTESHFIGTILAFIGILSRFIGTTSVSTKKNDSITMDESSEDFTFPKNEGGFRSVIMN